MRIDVLLQVLRREETYLRFLKKAQRIAAQDSSGNSLPGLSLDIPRAARSYVTSALSMDWSAPVFLLTGRPQEARELADQVRSWVAEPKRITYFDAPDSLFYDRPPWDRETISARIRVLSQLVLSDDADTVPHPQVIVSSMWAFMSKTLPPLAVRRATQRVAVDDRILMRDLLNGCARAGYERVGLVEQPGTFAQRGGLVDVYPPHLAYPVRIDFFGDRIDTIYRFDPSTQRSTESLQSVILGPASEALPEWGKNASDALQRMDLSSCNAATQQHLDEAREMASQGSYFRGFEYLLPYLYPRTSTILDYLPKDALILANDIRALESAISELEEQTEGLRENMVRDGDLPVNFPKPYLSWEALATDLGDRHLIDLAFGNDFEPAELGSAFAATSSYAGDLDRALAQIDEACEEGQSVAVITRQAERLSDLLRERQIYRTPVEELANPPSLGELQLVDGILSKGFELKPAKLTVVTDAELFGWVHKRRRRPVEKQETAPEAFFEALNEGDYVVHVEHGIGQYHGMVQKKINGLQREYVEIEYAAGDRLYVPVHQTNRISRYSSGEARTPRIHRLGGTEWETVRAKAEKQVRELAKELLELYAKRRISTGHAFSPDTDWQRELEASFEYEETEDQLQALAEIKADMEKPRPMDRLLCGDVGYGKTEVALRAAFKAVMDGKQVAVLVPTTVLAQQHFRTFRQRLRPFPVMVEMLSRFRSQSEQKEIIQRLAKGQIDIIVGTHRILSADVRFKDLGLLIIDEEQRFGVAHKERIKQLRHRIDVLTMTATPIPRTLYMSLSGIRDMSVIDTPPENRLSIRTTVTKYHDEIVRRAVLRELDRGGQVYYVHNRVRDIESVADELHRIVPEASISIGHGQMPENELEQVMLGFAQGEDDILLCTTIIENGLDIPRANTILIDRADTFGLAQLYQLRGRIGRGLERGYAYLFYDPPLTPIARARLETIQEASELGAGFRVALRDLEIRGAGEILGPEQHGQIAAVGLDLYSRLLHRAVEELRQQMEDPERAVTRAQERTLAETLTRDMGPSVDLPLSAYIPKSYISRDSLRLQLYRRLARVSSLDELPALRAELEDRFGALPAPVDNLLYTLRIRVLAGQAGTQMIQSNEKQITIILPLPIDNPTARKIERDYAGVQASGTSIRIPQKENWRQELIKLLNALERLELIDIAV